MLYYSITFYTIQARLGVLEQEIQFATLCMTMAGASVQSGPVWSGLVGHSMAWHDLAWCGAGAGLGMAWHGMVLGQGML